MSKPAGNRDELTTFAPLTPSEVLKALLKVDPDDPPAEDDHRQDDDPNDKKPPG